MTVSTKSFDNKQIGGKKEFTVASPKMDFSDEDYAVKMAFLIDQDHACRRSKKKKFRRGFSKVIKGAFFQTKKTKSKKAGEEGLTLSAATSLHDDPCAKKQNTFKFIKKAAPPLSSSFTAVSGGIKTRPDGNSSSSSSSLSTFSNSQSSSMSSSRSTSARKFWDYEESISLKKMGGRDHCYYNCNMGLYFLVICLVGLVFCGKAFAIFFTPTCLYLFNHKHS